MEEINVTGIKMEAEIIFETHRPTALRRALEYAGNDGFVASMPQLLHARVNASCDNITCDSATPLSGGYIFSANSRFSLTSLSSLPKA